MRWLRPEITATWLGGTTKRSWDTTTIISVSARLTSPAMPNAMPTGSPTRPLTTKPA